MSYGTYDAYAQRSYGHRWAKLRSPLSVATATAQRSYGTYDAPDVRQTRVERSTSPAQGTYAWPLIVSLLPVGLRSAASGHRVYCH